MADDCAEKVAKGKTKCGSPVAASTGVIFVAFEATGTAVCAMMAAVVVCGYPLTGTSGCASIPPFISTRCKLSTKEGVSFCKENEWAMAY